MVSGSAWARDGLRLFGVRVGRRCFSVAEQYSDSTFRVAPCPGNYRLASHDSVDSGGNFRYALCPGRLGAFTGWGFWRRYHHSCDRGIQELLLNQLIPNFGRRSGCDSHNEFLAYFGGINRGHWRHWRGNPTFHLVSEGCGLFLSYGVAIFYGSASSKPWRPRIGGLRVGPLPKKRRDGDILRRAKHFHSLAELCTFSRCGLGVCNGFWFFDGRGLHADSVGGRGMFWDGFTREAAGADYNGLFARTVGSAVDRGKNL